MITLIIPASLAEAGRNIAACVAPGGHGMWLRGLSPDGTEPATHYISSGIIKAEFAAVLSNAEATWAAAEAGAAAQGIALTASFEDCAALVAQGDNSSEDPYVAMARLGLQFVESGEIL